MRTPSLTCIYFLTLLSIVFGVGCSRQDEQLTDIAGISALEVEHSSSTSFAELAWSPDGRFVAARAYTELNSGTVTIINLLTGTARNIYDSGGAYMLGPEWSPDGQLLIFRAPTESIPHIGGVVVTDADTGQITHNLGFGGYAT